MVCILFLINSADAFFSLKAPLVMVYHGPCTKLGSRSLWWLTLKGYSFEESSNSPSKTRDFIAILTIRCGNCHYFSLHLLANTLMLRNQAYLLKTKRGFYHLKGHGAQGLDEVDILGQRWCLLIHTSLGPPLSNHLASSNQRNTKDWQEKVP